MDKRIDNENKIDKLVQNYLNELAVNGQSEASIKSASAKIKVMRHYAEGIKKPFTEWKREDINAYVMEMRRQYSAGSVETRKAVMKPFFKFLGMDEIVNHITCRPIMSTLRAEQILLIEDIEALISHAESPMYKAFIAFLFESGGRINEVLSVRLKDIEETDRGMYITFQSTKTAKGGVDYRRFVYPYSAKYIRNHLNYSVFRKDDRLFAFDVSWANKVLKRIARKAGIQKPVNPHAFRHAQATYMLRLGQSTEIVRKKHGWSRTSQAMYRYLHLVDDDVNNAILEKASGTVAHQAPATLSQPDEITVAKTDLLVGKLNEELEQVKLERAKDKAMMEEIFKEFIRSRQENKALLEHIQQKELEELEATPAGQLTLGGLEKLSSAKSKDGIKMVRRK